MPRVYIGLGTNLGDRWGNLLRAVEGLQDFIEVDSASPVYETEPWGYIHQPRFLNAVVTGTTALSPRSLLEALKALETRLGRKPTFRYGPRVIDLDILLYDMRVLETPELQVPHPHLHERAFVLVPLCDLAPDLVHPKLGRRMRDLLQGLDVSGVRAAVAGTRQNL